MPRSQCVYCGTEFDPDSQSNFSAFNCSFHPMHPKSIGNTGPRQDYAELWVFPCCGKGHVGGIDAGGSDVTPARSPGCINCFHSISKATLFISYSRTDQQFVSFLEAELQRRGYVIWRDTSNLLASEDWQAAIRSAIDTCTHVVLVASSASLTRPEVNREIGAAAQAAKTIIPIVLDDVALPAWVQRLNYIDWRAQQDYSYSSNFELLDNAIADPIRMRFLQRIRLGAQPGGAESDA
jgi:hypothetical protein